MKMSDFMSKIDQRNKRENLNRVLQKKLNRENQNRLVTLFLGAMVKMIKIETLHWKMVKSEEFNFLKVKTLLNSM